MLFRSKGARPDAQAKTASPGAAPAPSDTPAGSYIKDSSLQTFAADVLDASMEVPVIVDFWAPWCGPCKQLGPLLERTVEQAKGAVRLVKVNIDENPEIAQQLRIQSIPTLVIFRDGRERTRVSGARPAPEIQRLVLEG
mgnify:CR=1 FL=1